MTNVGRRFSQKKFCRKGLLGYGIGQFTTENQLLGALSTQGPVRERRTEQQRSFAEMSRRCRICHPFGGNRRLSGLRSGPGSGKRNQYARLIAFDGLHETAPEIDFRFDHLQLRKT